MAGFGRWIIMWKGWRALSLNRHMKTTITFLLNGVEESISDIRPDTTLLNWLRLERGLKGTKEGCAEGDCGACSVVVAGLDAAGQITAKAVNACILFLPMLDGLAVTTVEGVAHDDGALHPVQDAIIAHHGAQCGFCTPGFVMSLYAGFRGGLDGCAGQIDRLLAGNLCRCTGYGGLVQGGVALAEVAAPVWDVARQEREAEFLKKQDAVSLHISGGGQDFYAPTNLEELASLAKQFPDAVFLNGATDIGLWVTKQHRDIACFIALGRVKELRAITHHKTYISIGSAVRLDDAMAAMRDDYGGMREVWCRFASAQIRHAGSLGGNIANASPIGDLSPCLLALDARLVLNHFGDVRELALKDFFISYGKQDRRQGEFLAQINIPRLGASERFYAYKISKRFDQDISAVLLGAWLDIADGVIRDVRLGFGGMAGVPARATNTEASLRGAQLKKPLPDGVGTALAEDFTPLSDLRASAAYRLQVAENLLQKMLLEASADSDNLRLYESEFDYG